MSANERISVEKVARLARIQLDPEQTPAIQSQMENVLLWIDQIDQLDLSNVEPFFGPVEPDAFREDNVSESLSRDRALHNAPEHDGEFYRVPPVF